MRHTHIKLQAMLRIIVFSIFLASLSVDACAIDLFKKKEFVPFDYTAWTDTARLNSSCGDLPADYPKSIDGTAVVTGSVALPGIKGECIFAAAMCHAVETMNPKTEKIEQADYSGNSFLLFQHDTRGSNNTETAYSRHTLIECGDGELRYTSYDLDARYREKGIIPRTLPFEKLNPADNPRHRELIEEFSCVNASEVKAMADFIKEHPDLMFHNTAAMSKGKVTEGMTELEVKVLLGMPPAERKSGERTRWIYSNDLIIIFTDGKVTKVID